MTNLDYRHYSFCPTCEIKQPIVRRMCEYCNRQVRHNSHHKKSTKRKDIVRYGIAFIPMSYYLITNLYNMIHV